MKKLIVFTAIAMLAASADAGRKCRGNASSQQTSRHTYTTVARPVHYASVHAVAVAAAHSAAAVVAAPAAPAAKADIVDTAVSAGSFKTLVAAVKAAGLVETLKGKGPFTVFAPTDEAFAKLPAGTVETLLKPENKAKLQAILTYHVVAGTA
jgi:uncharacterized surface protein with fasciclin (FAS1) repeats